MPRLGHKKSRLGCRQCKARHVKCDELKPCSNCSRHGVPCSLVTWDPNVQHLPSSSASASGSSSATQHARQPLEDPMKTGNSSTPSPSLHIDYVLNPPKTSHSEAASVSAMSDGSSPSSHSDQFTFLTRFIHQSDRSQADIWVRDLELMHHWTTEAHTKLSHREDMLHLWRDLAPQHAVNHTFFMHEILAMSALHKAHILPEQRVQYYAFGVHHQDLTIRGVREKIQNITADEAVAIVATSTLLTLSVFASTGFELSHSDIPNSIGAIDGMLNIFILMQGITDVIAIARELVTSSFLAPMFRDPVEPRPSQPMFQELKNHLPELLSYIESKPHLPEAEREIYIGAVRLFDPILQMSMQACTDNRELRFLFAWPLRLLPEFVAYIRQRRPGAIAILMHYSTILYISQTRYWYLDGWGTHLIQACHEVLEPDWLSAVQWPMSFIKHTSILNFASDLLKGRHGVNAFQQLPAGHISGSPQSKSIEVVYRQTDSVAQYSAGSSSNIDMPTYSMSTASSVEMHDQKLSPTMYAEQSRSRGGTE